jgi:hypothetical protein
MLLAAEREISARLRTSSAGLFWLLLGLNVINHLLVLIFVNLRYVDSDQAFMWGGVADFAAGRFHEPRWYGQDYSSFIEALIAVPFYWMRLPVYFDLPFATHLLSLFPFMVPAIILYRKQEYQSALLFLSIPLCLSVAFDIVTGIPRGFIGGLAFTAFFVRSLHDPKNMSALALNTVLAVVGYFINPNSLIVSAPVLLYVFLHNYDYRRFYFFVSLVIPAYVLCYFLFDHFYDRHPSYVVYSLNLDLSFSHLKENLLHFNTRLAHIGFFSGSHPWFLYPVFLLLLTALWIFDRKAFYASLLVPVLILLVMFSNKGSDGSTWPFYSYARSYIGVPLFIALFATLIPWRSNFLMTIATVMALTFSLYKLFTFRQTLDRYLEPSGWLGVHLVKMPEALDAIKVYRENCIRHGGQQLMVSNNFWLNTVLAYGGGAVYKDFPLAFETHNERRYWLREELGDHVVDRFVFISSRNDLERRLPMRGFTLKKIDNYGLYLVKDNRLTNQQFMQLSNRAEIDN